MVSVNSELSMGAFIDKLSVSPRKIFGLEMPAIEEGAAACITLFDPAASYTFHETMIASKSKNAAFVGKQLKGKVIGIVNKDNVVLNK